MSNAERAVEPVYELTTSDGETYEVNFREIQEDTVEVDGDALRSIYSLQVGERFRNWAPVGMPTWSVRRVS